MRIACVSDLHGYLPEIPECDLLLIGGDLSPMGPRDDYLRWHSWFDWKFRTWLERIKVPVIAVAGNHDFLFQDRPGLVPTLPWTYLQDSGCEFQGLKVWGSPWQPVYGGWAFNTYEEKLREQWSKIPDNTDILLLHGPPRGYGDFSPGDRIHTGSPTLTWRIEEVKPKLVVFGHIHSGYGQYWIEDSLLVNAALVDEGYFPANEIQVVEIQ